MQRCFLKERGELEGARDENLDLHTLQHFRASELPKSKFFKLLIVSGVEARSYMSMFLSRIPSEVMHFLTFRC